MISSELEAEWHPTLNLPLLFNTSLPRTRKYWWQCKQGHEWEVSAHSRMDIKITGCPICANLKVLVGFNDLATTHHLLAMELHPTKNGELTAQRIAAGSGKKVWWLGQCGHEWEASPSNRSKIKANGCPVCTGRKILVGFNDLASIHPSLAAEWHPIKNEGLTSEQVTSNSNKKVWWLCKEGHEWQALIQNRSSRGDRCPICSGKKIVSGFNDLATLNPFLTGQWHPTKNLGVTPDQISSKSKDQIWWLGECGHEWQAAPVYRSYGDGCPYCGGLKALSGFNDLSLLSPDIAGEWHPIKNGKLRPEQVTSRSGRVVWWLGKCGHEWDARVADRTYSKQGCAICSNRRVLIGFNDLSTTHAGITTEWHPYNNEGISPQEVTAGSNSKFWWLGICGHEWKAVLASRTGKAKSGCPHCSNLVSKAEGQIQDFLESLGLTVEGSNRTIFDGKEIDLWIPAHKVGIEFNGIHWHTEKRRGTDAHHDKWLAAQKAGIQLIQIWEDDWNQKPELVKRMLANKLGVAEKLLAEETEVVTVTKQQAEEFLNENHFQGYVSGAHYLGLVIKGDIETLRAVMVLDEEPGTDGKVLNILRYATSANVVGGFAKLLSYAKKSFNPKSITVVADHCEANAELYENNGFSIEEVLPPDYMYVVKNERKDKSEYPLERFRDDPKLLWEEGLTEIELADLNGLDRIWDAGKTLYRLVLVSDF